MESRTPNTLHHLLAERLLWRGTYLDDNNPLITGGESARCLFFMAGPDVSFTNNAAEQEIRMGKVKIKLFGTFRAQTNAQAWGRISSDMNSVA